jgi:hypothetical protein
MKQLALDRARREIAGPGAGVRREGGRKGPKRFQRHGSNSFACELWLSR